MATDSEEKLIELRDQEDDFIEEEPQQEESQPMTLDDIFAAKKNILDVLDESEIGRIESQCTTGYDLDHASRQEWFEKKEESLKLAKQICEEKTYPWPKASNVKYPLLTVACLQFNARAYPAIVSGKDIAKCVVNGYDPDGIKKARADRVSSHMSWQLLYDIPGWEENMDKMFIIIPCVGMAFKKTYYCPVARKNKSEFILADNVVFNYDVKDFDSCNRVSHVFKLYPNEFLERKRSGLYREIDLYPENTGTNDEENKEPRNNDEDGPHTFFEQHTWYDLDEDGYKEPYIITIHKDSRQAVRMTPRFEEDDIFLNDKEEVVRINPIKYFTKYGFIPNPDGSAHDIGFGDVLTPINESVNTSLNMMLDAGHLQNVGGGFIGSGLRIKGGPIRQKLGEYVQVGSPGQEIRNNLVQFNHPGPSPVLFQLLGMLIEAGKDISSVKDIMTGQQPVSNTPASTTLAMIEQGMKTFTAIFKRVHRSFGEELRKIYRLNGIFMDEKRYFTFQDVQNEALRVDYRDGDLDITPVADPTVVTDMQKMARAEALMPFAQDPEMNGREIKSRYLQALGVEDIQSLWATPEQQQQMAQQAQEQKRIMMEQMMVAMEKARADIAETRSKAIKNVASAEAEEIGSQLSQYEAFIGTLETIIGQANAGGNGQPETQQTQRLPAGVTRLPA